MTEHATPKSTSDKELDEARARDDDRLKIERARLHAAVARLDREWFLLSANGKTRCCRKEDGKLSFYSVGDFKARYQNLTFTVGEDTFLASNAWLTSTTRPSYDGITMRRPAGQDVALKEYNLFEGLGVEPVAGDWSPMREFLRSVICTFRDSELDYLLDLLAVWFQHPLEVGRVAIQLRGDKGTGKSTFGRILMEMFGRHAIHLSSTRQISGNFNAHLMNTLYVFADEATWFGDKAGMGNLKRMITEPTLFVEQKGIDGFSVPNRLKLVIASNSPIPLPATRDERRIFALDLNNEKQRDFVYFENLMKFMKGGGCEAFLYHLLSERKPNIASITYDPPDTSELKELMNLTEDDWALYLREHGFRQLQNEGGEHRLTDTAVWLSLDQNPAEMLKDRRQGERKNEMMKLLGWSRKQRFVSGKAKWFWVRPAEEPVLKRLDQVNTEEF